MASSPTPLPRVMSLAVHELRTPITVVGGYLRMVLREQAGPLTEKQRKMLEEAERSCGRIDAVVTEMSDFGKLEAGSFELARQPVDMAALLAELASGMHEGEDRGVWLELRGVEEPVMVTGDRSRLATTLRVLMSATLRERGEPGAVIASCSTVVDNGTRFAVVAFAEESLLPILTQDGAADALAFDEYRGGTGMGLPLARRIIERHGGTLWSAATAQELDALNLELRSGENRLPDGQHREFSRKRATSAFRLPLRT